MNRNHVKTPSKSMSDRETAQFEQLATTLFDGEVFSTHELSLLHRRCWQVELHIRSLKTPMQMDHLRCKSPQMVFAKSFTVI